MLILGVHNGHDSSCALLRDGRLVAFIEEERLNREKHGVSLHGFLRTREAGGWMRPKASIRYVLAAVGVTAREIDWLILGNEDAPFAAELAQAFPRVAVAAPDVSHHELHAYAAAYDLGAQNALVLVVDYNGSAMPRKDGEALLLEGESAYRVTPKGLAPVFQNAYRHDAGHAGGLAGFYTSAALRAGCQNSRTGWDEPGKFMALAAYGENLPHRFHPVHVGPYALDFSQAQAWLQDACPRPTGGLPDEPGSPGFRDRADFAAGVQATFTEEYVRLATLVLQEEPWPLAVAGGGVMNIVANAALLRQASGRTLRFHSLGYDAGHSIGAAYYQHLRLGGAPRPRPCSRLFPGRRYVTVGVRRRRSDEQGRECARLAQELRAGKVLAWFEGATEAGQRALGHRSMLASPAQPCIRERINILIKEREPYRPLSPVLFKSDAPRYFGVDSSPYMLLAATASREFREIAPAAMHADGTARLQTITPHSHPLLSTLLTALVDSGAPPVVINTSLNVGGEPICESPQHAVATFHRGGLDFLVINGEIVLERAELRIAEYQLGPGAEANLGSAVGRGSFLRAARLLAIRLEVPMATLIERCAKAVTTPSTIAALFSREINEHVDALEMLTRLLWRHGVIRFSSLNQPSVLPSFEGSRTISAESAAKENVLYGASSARDLL